MVCERKLALTVKSECFEFLEYTWSSVGMKDEPVHHCYIIFSRSAETFLQSDEQAVWDILLNGRLRVDCGPRGSNPEPFSRDQNSRTSTPYVVM